MLATFLGKRLRLFLLYKISVTYTYTNERELYRLLPSCYLDRTHATPEQVHVCIAKHLHACVDIHIRACVFIQETYVYLSGNSIAQIYTRACIHVYIHTCTFTYEHRIGTNRNTYSASNPAFISRVCALLKGQFT